LSIYQQINVNIPSTFHQHSIDIRQTKRQRKASTDGTGAAGVSLDF